MQRILVTGANGFVGRVLIQRALDAGHAVTAAYRSHAPTSWHPKLATVNVGDIDGRTRWVDALQGVESIIHAAGRAHVMAETVADPLREFRRVNTEGTAHLAESASRSGARRLVFVSSIKVNGERTGSEGYRESDTPNPGDAYGVSKLEAELALSKIAERTSLEVVRVRPPLVFGPGVKANFLSLLRWIDRGLPLPLGAVDNRRSMVSVWNLSDLLLRCAHHPGARGQLFLACDDGAVSTAQLVRMLAAALDRTPRLLPVPPRLLTALGSAVGKSAQVRRLCESLVIDGSKARELLQWSPIMTFEEGLQQTAKWYRESRQSQPVQAPLTT